MAYFTNNRTVVFNFGHTLESPGCFENPEAQAISQVNNVSISVGVPQVPPGLYGFLR